MNKRFKQLIQQYGYWWCRAGKGSHRVITNGCRRLTVSQKAWQDGDPNILENLEKQLRRVTA